MAPNNRPRMIHMNHLVQKLVRFVLRSLRVDILDWKGNAAQNGRRSAAVVVVPLVCVRFLCTEVNFRQIHFPETQSV